MARPIVFRLTHKNTDPSMMKYDSQREEAYAPVVYPPHVGIPTVDEIYDPRVLIKENGQWIENPNKGRPTRIRLAKGEASIFVDEQSEDADNRRAKLAFENGIIDVDPELERTKLQYLRLTNLNKKPIYVDDKGAEKENPRMKSRQIVFFEMNYKKQAKEQLDEIEKQADAMYIAKRMKFGEVKRYARVLGMAYNLEDYESEEIRHTFLGFVKRNPDLFLQMLDNNEDVEIKDIVLRAIEEEVIEVSDRKIKWVDGGTIYVATKGRDTIDSFVTYVQHDEDGMEVFAEIAEIVEPDEVGTDEAVADKRKENEEEANKALIETAFELELFKWEGVGTGFVFGDYKLGKQKNKVAEAFYNNKEFMDDLKKEIAKLQAES